MYQAELSDCTDGDTAVFMINGKEYKTRFLYIDTPEAQGQKSRSDLKQLNIHVLF